MTVRHPQSHGDRFTTGGVRCDVKKVTSHHLSPWSVGDQGPRRRKSLLGSEHILLLLSVRGVSSLSFPPINLRGFETKGVFLLGETEDRDRMWKDHRFTSV